MRKALILLITFLLITNVTLAKEYRIDKVKATFDIPNDFVVATLDNVPNEVIMFTGLNKDEVLSYLNRKEAVLVGYKKNHMITIRSHSVDTSKKYDDNLKIPEETFNDPKVLDSMKKNWPGCKVSTKRTENAAYYIIDQYIAIDGEKLHSVHYSTIKNAVLIGIEGLSFININKEMDADIDYILQHVKYDNDRNLIGVSQSKSYSDQGGFRKLKFGMSFQQVEQIVGKDALIVIPMYGPTSKGKNPADKSYYLKLNPPMLSNIKTDKLAEIHFFKDQLMSIEIMIHGDKDKYSPKELINKFNELSYNMEILYGKPETGKFSKIWKRNHEEISLSYILNEKNMNNITKADFDKLNEKDKEKYKNHVVIFMYSPALSKAHVQNFFEEFKKEQRKNASQGW